VEAGTSSGSAFWLGLLGLVILIVVGSGCIPWARRMARGPAPGPAPGFTLEDLRAMLDRGEITQREFDTARDAMLHKTRRMATDERTRRGGTDWGGPESKRKPAR
jgi:hypothetical protein